MKKLALVIPDELHEKLRELAFHQRTRMSVLVRKGIEHVTTDALVIADYAGIKKVRKARSRRTDRTSN